MVKLARRVCIKVFQHDFSIRSIIKLWNELPQSTYFSSLNNCKSLLTHDFLIMKCTVNFDKLFYSIHPCVLCWLSMYMLAAICSLLNEGLYEYKIFQTINISSSPICLLNILVNAWNSWINERISTLVTVTADCVWRESRSNRICSCKSILGCNEFWDFEKKGHICQPIVFTQGLNSHFLLDARACIRPYRYDVLYDSIHLSTALAVAVRRC